MNDKTFKSELNFEQVDVFSKDETLFIVDGEEHTYFNVKIDWGLHLYESMRELDIVPFVDRIFVTSGDSVSDNKMIIVKHDFVDITNADSGKLPDSGWTVKMNFLRDDESVISVRYRWHVTIVPKFVSIDVDKKIVEVIFNA